ncbi:MAG: hypothetical protein H0Z24_05650 [Thermosipho sp. (in: Bacteria)]|nr:hypothetical protein [Thermosipho sp. (in: thermotogales)]
MLYTTYDFISLEKMTESQVRQEIELAKQKYEEVQEYFKMLEEMTPNEFLKPDLEIHITTLKNIESYIRKAENLLNEWDSNSYIRKARKRFKTFNYNNINNKYINKIKIIKIK